MGHRKLVRVVGVANDAQYWDLHSDPTVIYYLPLAQRDSLIGTPSELAVAIRTSRDPVSLAPAVRRAIARVAPGVTIRRITSVGQLLNDALARERFAAALGALFGAVALTLAILGVYGVIAYNVSRRTAEIGVRMALGATPAAAVWLALRQALVFAGIGLAIGIPLALAASRAVASQFYGVEPGDPKVMASAACVLACCALLAAVVPGRRAARVDPAVALRSD
jgi:ABC-type lipoprotein release transport system permease subunit